MTDRLSRSPGADSGMTRRHALAVFGGGALAVGLATAPADATSRGHASDVAAAQSAVCQMSAEVTQGPYYLQHSLVRKNITEDKSGFPLNLTMTVVDSTNGCTPVAGVPVEIWHCDAWGYYSGYTSAAPGGTVPALEDVGNPSTFLRGVQVTDAKGRVQFVSIVPGWYSPRVTHIHVKVHQDGDIGTTYENGSTVHTTQVLLPDDVCQEYSVLEPYAEHQLALTLLENDQVYNEALSGGGDPTTMVPTMSPINADSLSDGYNAAITLGIDPSATSSDTGGPGGGGNPPPGGPGGPPPGGAPASP